MYYRQQKVAELCEGDLLQRGLGVLPGVVEAVLHPVRAEHRGSAEFVGVGRADDDAVDGG